MRLVFPCCYDCSSELEDEGLRRSLLYLSPVVLIVHVQGVGTVGEAVEQASHERLGPKTSVCSLKGWLLVTMIEPRS